MSDFARGGAILRDSTRIERIFLDFGSSSSKLRGRIPGDGILSTQNRTNLELSIIGRAQQTGHSKQLTAEDLEAVLLFQRAFRAEHAYRQQREGTEEQEQKHPLSDIRHRTSDIQHPTRYFLGAIHAVTRRTTKLMFGAGRRMPSVLCLFSTTAAGNIVIDTL